MTDRSPSLPEPEKDNAPFISHRLPKHYEADQNPNQHHYPIYWSGEQPDPQEPKKAAHTVATFYLPDQPRHAIVVGWNEDFGFFVIEFLNTDPNTHRHSNAWFQNLEKALEHLPQLRAMGSIHDGLDIHQLIAMLYYFHYDDFASAIADHDLTAFDFLGSFLQQKHTNWSAIRRNLHIMGKGDAPDDWAPLRPPDDPDAAPF